VEYLDLESPFRNHCDSNDELSDGEEAEEDEDEDDSALDFGVDTSSTSIKDGDLSKTSDTLPVSPQASAKKIPKEKHHRDEFVEAAVVKKQFIVELRPPLTPAQTLAAFLTTTASFVTKTTFLFGLLIKYLATRDSHSGCLFLLATLVVLTCEIYYFPGFRLTHRGHAHLRVIKWIMCILSVAVFLFILRSCMYTV
jgi:hypothetical protein